MEQKGLSIILPVYNEQKAIEETISQLSQVKKNIDFDVEIILINDGSNDSTEVILRKLSQEDFRVIHHQRNLGYGAALKTGVRAAKYAYIAITDADKTYPNDRIPEFFRKVLEKDIDMLVGARTGKNVKISLIRKPAKWVLNKTANYLANVKIPDINSGFRIMKKEVVKSFLKILPDGFSFTTTITLAMEVNGCSIKYEPINYFGRKGKSKIKPIKDTLNFLQLIIRTILYFSPLKIFIPLSLFLVILAFLVLLGSWVFLSKPMDVTFGVILMTAVFTITIGMLADLINKRIK